MSERSKDATEEIRVRADIVELIQSHLPLKRSGQNFVACCPFHHEKTPSFNVNPVRGIYKCFGCGKGGSVFDFMMEFHHVDFAEARTMLAERVGVSIDEGPGVELDRTRRLGLEHIHARAQAAFRHAYDQAVGAECRAYVEGRGLSREMVRAFGIGYAPGMGSWLVDKALAAGFSGEMLERSGLAARSSLRPGLYDRFRNRLVFPIRSAHDKVVAFGARTLDGSEPKYLNSPETEIFHKRRILFGLDRLRGHRHDQPILVTEGYTDVIMSTQVGVPGVVATLGTSLTAEHANLLKRYTDRIILVYDGDRPGLIAAERACGELMEAGFLQVEVALLPEGQDPCDYFQERGADGVGELLEETQELTDFLIARALRGSDGVGDRQVAARKLLERVALVPDSGDREIVAGRVAEALGMGRHSLQHQLESLRVQRRPRARPGTAPAPVPAPSRDLATKAEQNILRSLVNRPDLLPRVGHQGLAVLPGEPARRIVATMMDAGPPESLRVCDVVDLFDDPELRDVVRGAILPEETSLNLVSQLESDLDYLKNRRRHDETVGAELQKPPDEWDLRAIQDGFRQAKGRAVGPDGDGLEGFIDPDGPSEEQASE